MRSVRGEKKRKAIFIGLFPRFLYWPVPCVVCVNMPFSKYAIIVDRCCQKPFDGILLATTNVDLALHRKANDVALAAS
jgi:hypothetical protein